MEQWKSVLGSDELRFTLFRSDGRVWVWQLPVCIVSTRKFGGGGVMVWGCFSYWGVGPLMVVCGTMNSQGYCTILNNEMLPTLWCFYGMDPCYVQDNNVRFHVSEAIIQ